MTRAEQLRAGFNRIFYPDGRTFNRDARLFIEQAVISIDGEVYEVPSLALPPHATMRDLIHLMIVHLGNRPVSGPEPLPPPAKKKQELKAIEHITYRSTPYLVQHLAEGEKDVFIVLRDADDKDKGKKLSPTSPTFRAIVKKYRETLAGRQRGQGEEE